MDHKFVKPRSDTAEKILDVGENLIQTRSFNGFSYQDISDELGIKKASIHYHFASKSDLGAAIMKRYRQRLEDAMVMAEQTGENSCWDLLEFYFTPYCQYADTPDKVCLSGSLAGEFPTLPADMQRLVSGFFHDHQTWLARVLERGKRRGEFVIQGSTKQMARVLFDALQGALLVKRASGEIKQLHDVIDVFRLLLSPSDTHDRSNLKNSI